MRRYMIIHLDMPGDSSRNKLLDAYIMATLGTTDMAIEEDLYKVASVVEADNPEDLFAKTQNIDAPWTDVTKPLVGGDKQRSTSVGDLILDLDTGTTDSVGDILYCAPVGWKPLEQISETKIRTMIAQAFARSTPDIRQGPPL